MAPPHAPPSTVPDCPRCPDLRGNFHPGPEEHVVRFVPPEQLRQKLDLELPEQGAGLRGACRRRHRSSSSSTTAPMRCAAEQAASMLPWGCTPRAQVR